MIQVSLSAVQLISGFTDEEAERIKEDLTFKNPKYQSAMIYGRGFTNIPEYIYYYKMSGKKMILPRGYVIPFLNEIVSDTRVFSNTDYPPLRISLRGTQKEARNVFIKKAILDKDESGVIILPTGKGKSILGLYLAHKLKQKVLVIVQKEDLVTGWTKDAQMMFGFMPKDVGLIKAQEFRIGKQVTLTTIQTLSKLPLTKIRELHEEFGMIIVDEFHRSVAKIYDTVHYFPARYKIGLTATPLRNDGLQDVLYLYFGQIAYRYEDRSDDEDILPVKVKLRDVGVKYTPKAKYRKGRDGELVKIPENIHDVRSAVYADTKFRRQLARDIAREAGKGKSCIVFTHTKDHCEMIREDLLTRELVDPTNVQMYYGDMRESKEDVLKRAETKETLITVATYAIATEGTNVKSWERGFLASSVANEKDTIQSIGRCRRTKEGKEDCLIYDYRFPNVPNMRKHGNTRDKVYTKNGYKVLNPKRERGAIYGVGNRRIRGRNRLKFR